MCSESSREVDIVVISKAEIAILGTEKERKKKRWKSKKNSMMNDGLRKKVGRQRLIMDSLVNVTPFQQQHSTLEADSRITFNPLLCVSLILLPNPAASSSSLPPSASSVSLDRKRRER